MRTVAAIRPYVRVAHHYRFPSEINVKASRIGYCYAFHLIDGGKGRVKVSGHSYEVKKGDLLYFPPQVPHSFYTDAEHLLSLYNIYCELWSDHPPVTYHHLVWNATSFDPAQSTVVVSGTELDELPYFLPLQHDSALMSLFSRIVTQHRKREPYSDIIAGSLLKAFILEAVQLSKKSQSFDYRIKAVMDQIDNDPFSPYDSWLAQTGLQKTQFHELFKQASGMSPKAYRTKFIMEHAAAALRESGRSVTEIADDMGYSSIHHFTKQFTAYYGVSPSEFRNRRG